MIITVAAIVLSSVFSSEWFIKPKYKSFALIYPSNIIPYSSESQSEQLLQLLGSADIRNTVIKKFNLAGHYGIDTLEKSGFSQLYSTYESNVEVSRTQFESIEIKVLDEEPRVACEMVNTIIDALNLKARNLQRDKTKEIVIMLRNQLAFKKHQVDSLNTILEELRVKYQILDYDVQVKEVIKGYIKALNSGKNKEGIKDIDELMRNMEEKGGDYYKAKKSFDSALKSYNDTQLEFDNAMKDMFKELTYTNIITKPAVADKKSYPVRWLIVTTSAVSVNLFLFLILLLMDLRKKIN